MKHKLNSKQLYLIAGLSVGAIAVLFLVICWYTLGLFLNRPDPTPPPDVPQYTVVFEGLDGEEISVRTYRQGDPVEIPQLTEEQETIYTPEYKYTFQGWDQTIMETAQQDARYVAQYLAEKRWYYVTFCNEDGTAVLDQVYVEYGSAVTYQGPTPTKARTPQYSYTFSGWSGKTDFITGETRVNAQFSATINEYLITFLDADGKKYAEEYVPYGSDASKYCTPPEKEADKVYQYEFSGWSQDVSSIKGNMTVTAQYTEIYIDYVVSFRYKDAQGTERTQSFEYHYGDALELPDVSGTVFTGDGVLYFAGWDKDVSDTVEASVIYTAQYQSERPFFTLTVEYLFEDGTVAWETYQEHFTYGQTYQVESPAILYYTCELPIVSGTIRKNTTIQVIYTFDGSWKQEDGYYLISTAEQLQALLHAKSLWGENFRLENDIVYDGDWLGIGTAEVPFSGVFDGNGYTISGINLAWNGQVNDRGRADIGFVNVLTGKLQNLTLEASCNLTVREDTNIGLLAGSVTGGTVTGCTVRGELSVYGSSYLRAGSVAGLAEGGAVISGNAVQTILSVSSAIAGGAQQDQYDGCVGHSVSSSVTGNRRVS